MIRHVIEGRVVRLLPRGALLPLCLLTNPQGVRRAVSFVLKGGDGLRFRQRMSLVWRLYLVSIAVPCAHRQQHILTFIEAVLSLPESVEGCIVEAGSYKGGSTAKLSIAAQIANRQLVVFDSFEGIPENPEQSVISQGSVRYNVHFSKGDYCGTLEEVKANVARYGDISACRFVQGWFEETMPLFDEPVAAIFLDVNLASSTKSCLRHLYPHLQPGGILVSHDGHLPMVCQVFEDEKLWERDVGCVKPNVEILCGGKLLMLTKPPSPLRGATGERRSRR